MKISRFPLYFFSAIYWNFFPLLHSSVAQVSQYATLIKYRQKKNKNILNRDWKWKWFSSISSLEISVHELVHWPSFVKNQYTQHNFSCFDDHELRLWHSTLTFYISSHILAHFLIFFIFAFLHFFISRSRNIFMLFLPVVSLRSFICSLLTESFSMLASVHVCVLYFWGQCLDGNMSIKNSFDREWKDTKNVFPAKF